VGGGINISEWGKKVDKRTKLDGMQVVHILVRRQKIWWPGCRRDKGEGEDAEMGVRGGLYARAANGDRQSISRESREGAFLVVMKRKQVR